jgi:integrase
MNRKEAHSLNLVQLGDLLSVMMYPERDIALMSVLTDMSVAEICGLQWKYLNPSSLSHVLENDIIPPRTIAVRNQRFRGELSATVGNRRRLVRMPQLLCSHLLALKRRGQFTGPQDFVLVSRNGTPIHPENIAARRLKSIGKSFQMPWLSWTVFHRTRTLLRAEFGTTMHDEVGRLFDVGNMAPKPPRGYSQPTRDTRGLTLT